MAPGDTVLQQEDGLTVNDWMGLESWASISAVLVPLLQGICGQRPGLGLWDNKNMWSLSPVPGTQLPSPWDLLSNKSITHTLMRWLSCSSYTVQVVEEGLETRRIKP